MSRLLLAICLIFLSACDKPDLFSETDENTVAETPSETAVYDFNTISIPEATVWKANPTQFEIAEFDQSNLSKENTCPPNKNNRDKRVTVGDTSTIYTKINELSNLSGGVKAFEFHESLTVSRVSSDFETTLIRKRNDQPLFTTTPDDFISCGIEKVSEPIKLVYDALVNIKIDGKNYQGLQISKVVKGNAFCLKKEYPNAKVLLGRATQSSRQIYFHQMVDLHSSSYSCRLGGQLWFESSTIRLARNAVPISSQYRQVLKPVIRE